MIKIIALFIVCTSVSYAALLDTDKQDLNAVSIIKNGGFEDGRGRWTASGGTFSTVTSGSNLLTGKVSATWDSGSASQTLTSTAVAIPKGLYGQNGMAQCRIQTPSGTATHTIQAYDGTNVLASSTITSSTSPTYTQVNFIYPASGDISLRLVSVASDEPLIAIDDCWLGDAINISNVSQANFVGSAYFATTASCTWTTTSGSIGAFSTDADCPGPTVESNPGPGVIQTTDANLPQITVTNLPPGTYAVTYNAPTTDTGAGQCVAISDGTTTNGYSCGAASAGQYPGTNTGFFTYTSAGDRTFAIHGVASSTLSIANANNSRRTSFSIVRYPGPSEKTLTAATSAMSWSGYHDPTCKWARTNTAYGDPAADSTCVFTERTNQNFGTVTSVLSGGDKLPGVTWTAPAARRYYVCTTFAFQGGTGVLSGLQLVDQSSSVLQELKMSHISGAIEQFSLCGTMQGIAGTNLVKAQTKAASGAATINSSDENNFNWTIVAIDQQIPAPLLVNSVVNSSGGVTTVEVAKLNCDGASAITSQLGSWVASIGNIASGACAVTLSSRFSATPYCTATSATTGGISAGLILNVDATSSTAVSIDCEDDASSACTAFDFILTCVGQK